MMQTGAILAAGNVPHLLWTTPFVILLLCIAVLPLLPEAAKWWHHNTNKLLVAAALGGLTLAYYRLRGYGFLAGEHVAEPGWAATAAVFRHAVLDEYIPFISLLFALYVISGGICIQGDLPAHPLTNTIFLAAGSVAASLVGTTGASMLLIRPLLQTNSERKYVIHTVVFFIFLVSNIGGALLPIGDPPLFLGYLRGVPFLWTLGLWKPWLFCVAVLLGVYYMLDHFYWYPREPRRRIAMDERRVERLRFRGLWNLIWIFGAVFVTGTLDPSKPLPGTEFTPPPFLREALQLGFVAISWWTTPRAVHTANRFSFEAIFEVASLFIGIFICMQVPIEILHARGASLGLSSAAGFFWVSGMLSSVLDNAPTYAVFFETASSLVKESGPGVLALSGGGFVSESLLAAISLGAVFMGANTYIGNGPNFMVKSVAQHAGVKMPSFFGYLMYSGSVLIPLFVLVDLIFVRGR